MTAQCTRPPPDVLNEARIAWRSPARSREPHGLRSHAVRARGGLSPRARRRVLALIDAQLGTRLTIEMLASEAGLSRAHFARAFKVTTGHAPHRYLLALRLQRARLLLGERGASIADVALRTGFADQAHLTRLFKRTYGVTPGDVRSRAPADARAVSPSHRQVCGDEPAPGATHS